MKRTFKMHNLDCAHCAAKMEKAINKLNGVNDCSINFMTQKLILEAEEEKLSELIPSIEKAIKKVDRGCGIVVPEA